MRKCMVAILIVVVLTAQGTPASAGRLGWSTTLTGANPHAIDDALRVAVSPTLGVVVLGLRRTTSSTQSAFLARLAPNGSVDWVRELPARAPFMDPVGVVFMPSGGIAALVATFGQEGASGVLSSYSHEGTEAWSTATTAPADRTAPSGLALAPDGGIVVAARRVPPGRLDPTHGVVQRYDRGGMLRWTTEIVMGERNQLFDVAVDQTGRAHVSGWTRPTLSPDDLAQVLYAVVDRNGVIIRKSALGQAGMSVMGSEVAVSASGDVFVAGTDRVVGRNPRIRAYAASVNGNSFGWYTPLLTDSLSFNGGIALTPEGRMVQGGSEVDAHDRLQGIVRMLDARTGEEMSRRGSYHVDSVEEDVHDVAVDSAHEATAVGGRRLDDGSWRAFVARERLSPNNFTSRPGA